MSLDNIRGREISTYINSLLTTTMMRVLLLSMSSMIWSSSGQAQEDNFTIEGANTCDVAIIGPMENSNLAVNVLAIQTAVNNLIFLPSTNCSNGKTLRFYNYFEPQNANINKLYIHANAEDNLTITTNNNPAANLNLAIFDQIGIILDSQGVSVKNLTFRNHTNLSPITIGGKNPYDNGLDRNALPATDNLIGGIPIGGNRIDGNTFQNMSGLNIVNILPDNQNNNNKISSNTFTDWASGTSFSIGIKVGANRLQNGSPHSVPDDWALGAVYDRFGSLQNSGNGWSGTLLPHSYVGYPAITGTEIEKNIFTISENVERCQTNNQPNCIADSTVAIQLNSPSTAKGNIIDGSFNGISTKGSSSIVEDNIISNIVGDGALYLRDGHNNIFRRNKVQDSSIGVWLWSSKFSLFKDNVFANNNQLMQINEASHPGERDDSWLPSEMPWQPSLGAINDAPNMANETSFKFSADKFVFLNNTFLGNNLDIDWNGNGFNTSPRREIYFINNIIWPQNASRPDRNMFSIPGYNMYFANNLYRNGLWSFESNSGTLDVFPIDNSSTDSQPFQLNQDFTLNSIALTGGLVDASSLNNYPLDCTILPAYRGAQLNSTNDDPCTDSDNGFTANINNSGAAVFSWTESLLTSVNAYSVEVYKDLNPDGDPLGSGPGIWSGFGNRQNTSYTNAAYGSAEIGDSFSLFSWNSTGMRERIARTTLLGDDGGNTCGIVSTPNFSVQATANDQMQLVFPQSTLDPSAWYEVWSNTTDSIIGGQWRSSTSGSSVNGHIIVGSSYSSSTDLVVMLKVWDAPIDDISASTCIQ